MKLSCLTACVLAAGLLLTACGGEFNAYSAAKTANTTEAYKAFLEEYPDGVYAEEATFMYETVAWDTAYETDTSAAFEEFAATFPQNEHAEEARSNAASIAWREAEQAGDRAAIEGFLARYADSTMKSQAEARLAVMDLLPAHLEIGEAQLEETPDGYWKASCSVKNIGKVPIASARFRISWMDEAGQAKNTKRLWFIAEEKKNPNGPKDQVDPADQIKPLKPGKDRTFEFTFAKGEAADDWVADAEHTRLEMVELKLAE